MTRITYAIGEGRYTLEAEGHAGFYPGNDIVCAAVSALLQTCWAYAGMQGNGRKTAGKRKIFLSGGRFRGMQERGGNAVAERGLWAETY